VGVRISRECCFMKKNFTESHAPNRAVQRMNRAVLRVFAAWSIVVQVQATGVESVICW
jgi:hypothetical protein